MTSKSQVDYAYEPLPSVDSTRILELLAGSESKEISFRLHTCNLGNPQRYEAISYTWGDPATKVAATCEDKLLQITPNLQACLRQLRFTDRSRYLWADAVCINQADVLERESQVMRMRQIYRSAAAVLVWLGPDEENRATNAANAVTTISRMCCDKHAVDFADLANRDNLYELTQGVHPSTMGFEADTWQVIGWFYTRPWFSRLWVFQEAVSAKQVNALCGEVEFDWDLIGLTATWIKSWAHIMPRRDFDFRQAFIENAFIMRRRDFHNIPSACNIINWGRQFDATDPLDRIYAMLGFPAVSALDVQVNYRKSKAELYAELVEIFIRKSGNLEVLSYVQHIDSVDDSLPSWTPKWDSKFWGRTIGYHRPRVKWSASGRLQATFKLSPDSKTLSLKSIELDEIENITEIRIADWFYSRDNPAIWPMLDFWKTQVNITLPRLSEQAQLNALASTFVAGGRVYKLDCECCTESDMMGRDLAAFLHRCAKALGAESTLSDNIKEYGVHGNWSSFEIGARTHCWHRSFFSTNKGYIGLGPSCMMAGDVACVLLGGAVPYIVRPRLGKYQFLGEAYIHGIMNGEAISEPEGGFSVQKKIELY